jgi:hypothetical protein
MEIGMLIWGIIALSTGKFMLTRNKVVYGPMARVIGAVLILPLPVALVVGLAVGVGFAAAGKQFNFEQAKLFSPIEAGIIFVCFLIAMGIALATGVPVRKKRIPQDEEYFDDVEDRPGRRGRNRDDYLEEDPGDQRIQR